MKGTPLTPAQCQAIADMIQEDLFDFAKQGFALCPVQTPVDFKKLALPEETDGSQVSLKPSNDPAASGSGHIHIGLSPAFCGNLRLVRDFLMAQLSFTTFACGVFYRDLGNAPPFAFTARYKQVSGIIKDFQQHLNGQSRTG